MVAELANVFNDSDAVERIAGRRSADEVRAILGAPVASRTRVKIVTICGAGVGTSGILKVNAERVLARLGIEATVVATDLDSLAAEADDAQVILTSPEFVDRDRPHLRGRRSSSRTTSTPRS